MSKTSTVSSPKGRCAADADGAGTLNERLDRLHDRLLESVPTVDRIACALYDTAEDRLKTFINSTRAGDAIAGYEFKLADSVSLSRLAKSGEFRVIDDIPAVIGADSAHSAWLLSQGYRSSFTAPMYDNGSFNGLIFFNSTAPAVFSTAVQRDLSLYANLINMTISSELAAVRAISAAAQIARDFADLRDFETGAHLERVARYARIIAKAVAPIHHLSDEFVEHVYLFAPLHDIGKIGIADKILLKPGKLDPDERRIMESHVFKGRDIIARILGDFGLSHLPDSRVMANIVECHHQFLDGTGYPCRPQGVEVPIEARIVMVADIFDALTTRRPYKQPWTIERACAELDLMVNAGKLDADCVAAITLHAAEMGAIGELYHDLAA